MQLDLDSLNGSLREEHAVSQPLQEQDRTMDTIILFGKVAKAELF